MASTSCQQSSDNSTSNQSTFIDSKKDTIQLLFVGDIMCHSPQFRSVDSSGFYDFNSWFDKVKPRIHTVDLAVGNLETTLAASEPYRGYPRFKTPESLADALKNTGFDLLVTANNHSNDTGARGLNHTINKLKSLGLLQTGTFSNSLEKELHYPLKINVGGYRISFLNYTYDTNGIPTAKPTIVNEIDSTAIIRDIQLAKLQSPDLIIAIMHWGKEYRHKPSRTQRSLTSLMIREGVDHIIGAHPHVIQPVEIRNVDKSKHLIAYSLGNFISNQKKPKTDIGMILSVSFTSSDDKLILAEWESKLIWRHKFIKNGKTQYEIIPVREFINDTVYFNSSILHRDMIKAYSDVKDVVNMTF